MLRGTEPNWQIGPRPRRAARFLLSLPDDAPYRAPVLPGLARPPFCRYLSHSGQAQRPRSRENPHLGGEGMAGERPLRREGALGRQRMLHRERGAGGETKWQG